MQSIECSLRVRAQAYEVPSSITPVRCSVSSPYRHIFAPGEFNILRIEVAVQPFKGVLDQGNAHGRVWMSPRESHGSHVAGPAVGAVIHRTGFHKRIRMTSPFYPRVSQLSVAEITLVVDPC